MTFLLATRNRKKRAELRRLLKGIPVRLLTLDQFQDIPPISEDRPTLRGNAVKKAVVTSRHTILPVLADDSGLQVRVLGGRPGIRSARFAGPAHNDWANNEKLLRILKGIPVSKRKAQFVCWIAVAVGGRLIRTFEGQCAGSIGFVPRGRRGFGYDPLFIPRGSRRTMAQLSAGAKDRCSHRGRAAAKLKRGLKTKIDL